MTRLTMKLIYILMIRLQQCCMLNVLINKNTPQLVYLDKQLSTKYANI